MKGFAGKNHFLSALKLSPARIIYLYINFLKIPNEQ